MDTNQNTRNRLIALGSLAAVIAVGLIAYGYTLQLPLYWDDIWHFQVYVARDWQKVLFGWRPLVFASFKALAALQGYVDPRGQHALNLGAHLLNGCLCWGILTTLRLPGRRLVALGGGLLFILYPFSAQAVTWVAAFTHPLVTLLLLSAVLLFQLSRKASRGAGWLLAASLGCALLAPLANESGVVIPVLLAMLLWAERAPRRSWLTLLPYLACAAITFTALRIANPKDGRAANWGLTWFDVRFKLAYLLQALAYPLAPFVSWLYRRGIPVNPNLFAGLMYSGLLVGLFYILHRLRVLRYSLLACGWLLVATAPATIIMPTDYVLNGPRLLYVASFGAVLLWVLPLTAVASLPKKMPVIRLAAVAIVILAGLSGLPFINSVRSLSWETKLVVDRLKLTLQEASGRILSVNFPSALFLKQEVNLFGGYRPSILPETAASDLANLLALNGAPGYQIQHFRIKELYPEDDWKFIIGYWTPNATLSELQPILREQQQHVYRAVPLETITLIDAGNLEATSTQPNSNYIARFDKLIAMLDTKTVPGDREWQITLRWQCWQPPERDTMVLVHIYDNADKLVSVQDAYPLLGTSWPHAWQAGDIWRDVRYVTLPVDFTHGKYTVKIGLYTLADVVRLAAYDSAGQRVAHDEVIVGEYTFP